MGRLHPEPELLAVRIVVLSLVDDWDLGRLLAERGQQLLAWVRPEWGRPRKGRAASAEG